MLTWRSTLCRKHEALWPMYGKPQVLVSARIFSEPKTDVFDGFGVHHDVASWPTGEISLLAAKLPLPRPPCCLLFSLHARVYLTLPLTKTYSYGRLCDRCDYMETAFFNNNTLFKYIYAHKQDTRYVFEKADHEVIPIKGPLTEL